MKAPDSYYDQDDLEKANESLKELTATCSVTVELSLITKKGKRIPFEYKVSLIETTGGENIAISIGRDITDRVKADKALRESEERFKMLYESAPDAIFLIDMAGNFVDGNRAAEELAGYKREQLIGKNFSEVGLLPEEQLPKALENLVKINNGQAVGPDEFTFIRKDGSTLTLEIRSFPVKIKGQILSLGIARDITERKKAKNAMQESEIRFRELFNNMSSGVAVYKPVENGNDFVFTDLNRTSERIEKVKKEDAIGKKVTEVFPGVTEFGLLDVFQRVYKTGKPEYHPVSLYKDEKISGWRENYVYKLPSGEIVAVYDDITEKKQAEQDLRKSEELARASLNATSEMVYLVDTEGNALSVNDIAARRLGKTPDELIGKNILSYFPPDVAKSRKQYADKVTRSGKPVNFQDEREGHFFDISIYPTFDSQGKVDRLAVFVTDITEHKRAEEKLLLTQFAVDHARDAIFWVKPDGTFFYANEAACQASGHSLAELLSMTVSDLDPDFPADIWPEHWDELKRKKVLIFESRHRTKDGRIFPVEITAHYLKYKDMEYNFAMVQDLTERNAIEKRNLDYQERLKSLASKLSSSEDQERRRISAYLHDNISQELALGRIEIESLRKSVGSADKKLVDELSGRIKTVIKNVQSLTFDLSSPTLYKFGLEKAVDELLDDLFEKTEINYKLSHGKSPVQLDNNLSVLLFRCIRELLVNIIKHARAHNVEVAIRRDGDNIHITVNDDGIGFDFNRNELLMSRTGGFGLFNIQERIRFIGGNFDIQSQPGKGSRLALTVPIKTEMDLSKEKSDAG
jgi:PAS domain S-box-containing protein